MDIQLKKKPWFVRHKYYVSGGIVFLSLAVYTVALLFSPEKQRVSADTLGLVHYRLQRTGRPDCSVYGR